MAMDWMWEMKAQFTEDRREEVKEMSTSGRERIRERSMLRASSDHRCEPLIKRKNLEMGAFLFRGLKMKEHFKSIPY